MENISLTVGTYHCDGNSIIELFHANTDYSRSQKQHYKRILKLEKESKGGNQENLTWMKTTGFTIQQYSPALHIFSRWDPLVTLQVHYDLLEIFSVLPHSMPGHF